MDVTRRVEVRIDELVLHGFPPLDARAVGAAVERELAALLLAAPPAASAAADAVAAGSFTAPHGADAHALGAAVAGRIQGALAPHPRLGAS